jgi:hypothetical protein
MASALLTVLGATPGMAEDYPWCVIEPAHGPSPTCSFATLQQCQASSAGAGVANCLRNPAFKESPAPAIQNSPAPMPMTVTGEHKKRKPKNNPPPPQQ